MKNNNDTERMLGCLLGLACGDAVGTTLEFKARGTFDPIDDMVGGGPFGLNAGEWTDDTSMALCLAESLVVCRGFNAKDQMDRYVSWWQEGYWSSNGICFDIGMTVSAALQRYGRTGEPFSGSTDPMSAGNGAIMRLAPVVMYYFPDQEKALHYAGESARTTHGAAESIDASRLLAALLLTALAGGDKTAVSATTLYQPQTPKLQTLLADLRSGALARRARSDIQGSGYVVASLEAALWCFLHSDDYETAVLLAANLGDDADTTAAVVGQLAGAVYGRGAIPARWLAKVVRREEIESLANALASATGSP